MKYLVIILCMFSNLLFAQSADLEKTVDNIQASNMMQNKMLAELQNIYEGLSAKIDTALNIADVNTANIEMISDTLHLKVLDVHSNTHERIDAMGDIVYQNRLNWMIGSVLFLLILGGAFFLLNNQVKMVASVSETNRSNTENALRQANARLQELLDDANKELNTTKMALNSTQKDLESTTTALLNCKKDLENTQKGLEENQENLERTNQKIEELAAKLSMLETKPK